MKGKGNKRFIFIFSTVFLLGISTTIGLKLVACTLVILGVFYLKTSSSFACTTIIVGKNRTDDGSVLLAHSEDLGRNSAQQLVSVPRKLYEKGEVYETYSGSKIPQPKETYGYIASRIFDKSYYPGEYTTGINEYQVTVVNNMSWSRDIPKETACDTIAGGIIWTEFTQLALERAKTAYEAVLVIGQLCEKYHLSADPGTIVAVADPNEGWFVEIARDGQWIAKRVPDDGAVGVANCYRIGLVELNENKDVLHSPKLRQYAVEKGWYNPQNDEPFNFSDIYGEPSNQNNEFNTLRHKMIDKMLGDLEIVSKEDLMNIMRSAYEETEEYKVDEKTGSPFNTDIRTITRISTEISSVTQLRSWLPSEIGGVMWWNMGTSKTGVYVPWYSGIKEFPIPFTRGCNEYTEDSAYWTYSELTKIVDENYKKVIDKVINTWRDFEKHEMKIQKHIENEALNMYTQMNSEAANQFLSWYSNALGERSHEIAKRLINELKTETYK